jgi:tRNA threonylcarbamoyladenosine biosynthesis protein TsaE
MISKMINSESDLTTIAKNISNLLLNNKISIVKLYGEIGVGKTTLTKLIIKEITNELESDITSPTFNIVNCYLSKNGKNKIQHFDLYRIQKEIEIGEELVEMINDGSSISIIEWPDVVEKLIIKNRNVLNVFIDHCDNLHNKQMRIFRSDIDIFN